jgi:hypothetical protein
VNALMSVMPLCKWTLIHVKMELQNVLGMYSSDALVHPGGCSTAIGRCMPIAAEQSF